MDIKEQKFSIPYDQVLVIYLFLYFVYECFAYMNVCSTLRCQGSMQDFLELEYWWLWASLGLAEN